MRALTHKAAIVVCLLVLLAVTAVITAVAAPNTSAKPTVDPTIARWSPAKQTLAAFGQTQTAYFASAAFASAHPEAKNIPPTATHGPPVLGIQYKYPNGENMKLPLENEWYGVINGRGVALYAGYYATIHADGGVTPDYQQGYIAVAIGPVVPGPTRDYHEYLTPTKHGGLTITAVYGTIVSLVAKDGTPYTFNLDTRTFS